MALCTVKVVVLRVAVVVLVNTSTVQLETSQESRIDKFFQSAINGRPRYVVGTPFPWELVHQLVGVEMLVVAEDSFNQETPLFGISLPTALQILFETLNRRHRDGHASQ